MDVIQSIGNKALVVAESANNPSQISCSCHISNCNRIIDYCCLACGLLFCSNHYYNRENINFHLDISGGKFSICSGTIENEPVQRFHFECCIIRGCILRKEHGKCKSCRKSYCIEHYEERNHLSLCKTIPSRPAISSYYESDNNTTGDEVQVDIEDQEYYCTAKPKRNRIQSKNQVTLNFYK